MRKLKDLKKKVATKSGIAPETLGSTRTVVIDDTSVFLENHKGIKEYNQSRIDIDLGDKNIVVEGRGLKLDEFSKSSASVSGSIKTLRFESKR